MKYRVMRRKGFPMNLQLFAEGAENGGTAGDDGQDGDEPDENGEDNPEKKKFSQKDIDEAVTKRLAREKRKWQKEQKSEPQKPETAQPEENTDIKGDEKLKEAEAKAATLEMKWVCLDHDVKKDCVEDVLALAESHLKKNPGDDIEDAIEAVTKKYPHFKTGYEEAGEGQEKKSWGQRHGKPPAKESTVDDEIKRQMFGK